MSASLTMDNGFGMLPWTPSASEERRFRRLLTSILLLFLVLGLIMPWLPVLQPESEPVVDEPRRVTGLILEPRERESTGTAQTQTPEPPVASESREPERPTAERSEQQRSAPAPSERPEPSARERAESSGVLALRERVENMQGSETADSLRARDLAAGEARAAERERELASAEVGTGSGGIEDSEVSSEIGAGTELAGRATERVDSPVGTGGGERSGRSGRDHRGSRTDEEIQLVFDRNKNGIYSLYNRALRHDPTLQGQVVLRLTIAPSGEVTSAEIISSELRDSDLERRILARVRQLDFGAKDVEAVSINYPIDFFPS